jgi:hypothetical protein
MGAELHARPSLLSDHYNTLVCATPLPHGIRANACDLLLEYRLLCMVYCTVVLAI